jgi:phospholipase/carboxylesterase
VLKLGKKTERRALVLAGATCWLAGCRSETAQPSRASRSGVASAAEPADAVTLQVATVTDMTETERGGTAVVLMHGWGAAGDDLKSLAERVARRKSRFFMPAGLFPKGASGRAWWHLDAADHPTYAANDQVPPGYRAHPEVLSARHSIQKLLRDVRDRYAPERLVLGGFSQGAMLTLDVALAAAPAVDRAIVLSGVLIAESVDALHVAQSPRPAFFVSHGRADPVLPFAGGEGTSQLLQKYGFSTIFHTFEGGHQIPPDVVSALATFIYEAT